MGRTPSAVRRAQPADIPALVEIWRAMRAEADLFEDALIPDWRARLAAFLGRSMEEGRAVVWLAAEGPEILATALVLLKDDYPFCLFAPGFHGFIGCVYTAPHARRRGLATDLVGRAVAWARERGVTSIRLLPTEAAAPLYRRLGFLPVEDLEWHLPAPGPGATADRDGGRGGEPGAH